MSNSTVYQREILAAVNHLIQLRDGIKRGHNEETLREYGLSGYSLSELHVIQCIGESVLLNITSISQALGMTKGAISKICAKLLQRSIVEKLKMVDNQKETYFSLTDEGKQIFSAHEKLHRQIEARWLQILENYSPEELMTIKRFIADISNIVGHSR
ncbi:MarR family transcriptional regulator [Xenorhabdus griffiniae]|uniref:MarR family transcriptional regulator n=1 Tax=Xenorhabdus griffiniae TaxID=351672 RepID=A0ABY9XIW3_9GAMM|nr:MarR family transcriptional regulator [Xenorhabdus griffiniae]MBD1228999.1 MarR family transcriptional regulator [Xenorhabdus griffiniae]MBE8587476.1 MarR family transcriptional regulator [Xenorhabdus griffiniae]WMV72869.1 MarR family transcriptional regulator [Xenorhabdus griffiniae]WNH02548.1 MarR family transcriptional regulator [Xenorhabdus griffiniae]